MTGENLSGPKQVATLGVVNCAVSGCDSKGFALPMPGDDGTVEPRAPGTWQTVTAMHPDGRHLVLFVCSPSCVRRLAAKLSISRLGDPHG